jgi:membrane associated rhomboid family serine protease
MREIYNALHKNLSAARLTYLLALICFVIFLAIKYSMGGNTISDELLTKFGAPTAIEIYSFQYWGIVSNSFVHYEIGHFILNIIGLLLLGSYVERRIGLKYFLFFGLMASTISSAFQLAFSDDAGIGLSGVNYALFGFIFTKTFIDIRFRILTKNIALITMLLFIPFCEYMNRFGSWNVASIALIFGFAVGTLVAFFKSPYSKISKSGLISLLILSVVSVVYTPWSAQWNCAKGISLHEKGETKKAKDYYLKAIYFDATSVCANNNLKIIKVDELSGKAFAAHNRGDYLKARYFYEEILKNDAENSWARNNLKRLP